MWDRFWHQNGTATQKAIYLKYKLKFFTVLAQIRTNRCSEKGHPCLIPFDSWNQLVEYPLFITLLSMLVENVLIHCFMLVVKLNEFRVSIIKGHSRESKVLRKSRATKIPGICCLLLRSPVDNVNLVTSHFLLVVKYLCLFVARW